MDNPDRYVTGSITSHPTLGVKKAIVAREIAQQRRVEEARIRSRTEFEDYAPVPDQTQ